MPMAATFTLSFVFDSDPHTALSLSGLSDTRDTGLGTQLTQLLVMSAGLRELERERAPCTRLHDQMSHSPGCVTTADEFDGIELLSEADFMYKM